MTAPGQDWVEQARRLAAGIAAEHGPAVAGWVEQARRFTAGLAAEPGAPTSSEAPAGECTSCPVCVALAALRGRRPDVVEALADVLATAAAALRAQAAHPTRTTPDGSAAADAPAPDVHTDGTAPPEETVTHPAPAPVQRIDVA